jgi:hypothetical protein
MVAIRDDARWMQAEGPEPRSSVERDPPAAVTRSGAG